jgi:hypothetical protein
VGLSYSDRLKITKRERKGKASKLNKKSREECKTERSKTSTKEKGKKGQNEERKINQKLVRRLIRTADQDTFLRVGINGDERNREGWRAFNRDDD